jgi:predicted DNA-binding protein YlxM (UPF0122 family)
MITLFFFFVSIISSSLLFLSVRKNIELFEAVEEITDQINESLDLLEDYEKKLERKSKLEVMSDEPVIREVMNDIKGSKEAVKSVREKLSIISIEEDEK